MSLLGKKFSGPVARPMMPFYAAGLVILYGVNSFANALAATDEYKNDPRNPALKNEAPKH
ncbi:mitochondrial F1F0 ATP synthase-like protein subunit Atp18 [Delitschia confertaspora ATCC 74209]|uniref:Mitochondrial F1F0 ATP synthase-like protein subunit Atp18 n=1 Tax=Delitschia confertaspora ATCC 74209 TaxID=1513339 RepID=A0A9P4N2R9_9PLEO|nr:mitochondrial F1F0 ATP synthase-like protein subunit Atp18 [Delitschia confertaspora ATCC 74209]